MAAIVATGTGIALLLMAGGVPNFDYEPSCRAAIREGAASEGRDKNACLRDELAAKSHLMRHWQQFIDRDKAKCQQVISIGGMPSYVEFLTCLELNQGQMRAIGR